MPSHRHGNATHFFKIILQSTLQHGDLKIPTSFVRKYWKGLSNPVTLSLPNGDEWKVNWIERDDGGVWFRDGWKKFADYYKIAEGHLLMFRYELGIRSHFQVIIFDKSASEIDYPASVRDIVHIDDDDDDCEEVKLEQKSDDDEESHDERPVRYDDDNCEEVKLEQESDDDEEEEESHDERPVRLSPSMQPRKKMKSNSPNEEPSSIFKPRDGTDPRAKHHQNSRGRNGTRKGSKDDEVTEGNASILEDTKHSTALERAKRFRSKYPFFIRTMRSSYVHGGSMAIPCYFSRKYLMKNEIASIKIGRKTKRTWDVMCKLNTNKGALLTRGWRLFAEDNHLEVNDACVFEMINLATTQLSFNVVIFRATLQAQTPSITKDTNFSEASRKHDDESKNCFKIAMKERHTKMYVGPYIPKEFLWRYVRGVGYDIVRLQVGEKSWATKVVYNNRGGGQFSAGWAKFARECNLKQGHVCLFELIDDQYLVLKVSISTHTHTTN